MSFLVGHASKHGATGEVAERLADALTLVGRRAEADLFDAEGGDLRLIAESKEIPGFRDVIRPQPTAQRVAAELTKPNAGRVPGAR